MVAHRPEALTQRAGGAGGHDGADAPLRAAGRVDGEPHAVVGEAAAEGADRDAGIHGGDEVGRAHGDDAIEPARAHREVGRRVGREPGALSLDARAPAAGMREGEEPSHRLGGVGDDAGKSGGIALDAGSTDDFTKPGQHAVSHGALRSGPRASVCGWLVRPCWRTTRGTHGRVRPCRDSSAHRDRRPGEWPAWRRVSRRRR